MRQGVAVSAFIVARCAFFANGRDGIAQGSFVL